MEWPKCKHCGERHALSEPHVYRDEPKVKRTVARVDAPKPAKESRPMIAKTGIHCPTCTCEENRTYATNADRQRAYRQRIKQCP